MVLVAGRSAQLEVEVVSGRQVDPERTLEGIAERVVAEHGALDPALLESPRPLDGPGEWHPRQLPDPRASTSASPTSRVEAWPPRSPVSTRPSSQATSTAG